MASIPIMIKDSFNSSQIIPCLLFCCFYLSNDFFKKIIITKDSPAPYYNEDGVLIMSVYDFLLDENSLEN